jgi:predicted nucleic acid-binding protein
LEVVLLAEATKLSFYDASYLWLSRSLGVPLVTLDRRLEDAASGSN